MDASQELSLLPADATVRVLYVDDSREMTRTLQAYFEESDHPITVVTETEATAALERVMDGPPIDCIVSDYRMPEMDGLDLLSAVREDSPSLPFILLTGRGSEEVASEATAAGVTEYLQKATGTGGYEELASRILTAVDRWRARESYRELFNSASDGLLLFDHETGDLLDINQRLSDVLGFDRETLLTRSVSEFSTEEHTAAALDRHVTAAAEGEPQAVEWTFRTADGETVPAELRFKQVSIGGRPCVVARSIDISERTQREQTLRAMYRVTREMAGMESPEATCEVAVQTASEALPFPVAIVHEYDPAEDVLRPLTATQQAHERLDAVPTLDRGDGLPWQVFESGEPAIWADVKEYEAFDDFDDRLKIEGLAILPLGDHGILSVAPGDATAGQTEFNFAKMLAQNTRAVLDSDARNRELAVREQTLRAMNRVTREMTAATTAENVCTIAVRAARESLGFPIAIVHEHNPVGNVLRPLTATPVARERMDGVPTLDSGDGLPWQVFESGEPVIWDDVREYEAFDDFDDRLKIEGLAILPLGDHGILSVAPGEATDGPTDVNFAKMLAQNTRAVLDRVQRERQLGARERKLERQNDRLEEFASIAAHDLRNPLQVVRARAGVLEHRHDEESVTAIHDAVDRMEQLIEELLTLARQGESVEEFDTVDVADVASMAWSLVDTEGARLAIETTTQVRADESRLQQLFENLFRNAVEHGATDSASDSRQDVPEHDATSSQQAVMDAGDGSEQWPAETDEGDELTAVEDAAVTVTVDTFEDGLCIADDGPGIPPADREKVFDKGFTTSAEGTGWGLQIVEQIASAHDWEIAVTESETGGARFEISDVEFV